MHPVLEGKNMMDATDLDGNRIFETITTRKTGVLKYRWLNAETQEEQEKVVAFRHYPEMDWIVAASVNESEVHAATSGLRTFMIFLNIGSFFLMIACSWFFGAKIGKKLSLIGHSLGGSTSEVQVAINQLTAASVELSDAATNSAASLEETLAVS